MKEQIDYLSFKESINQWKIEESDIFHQPIRKFLKDLGLMKKRYIGMIYTYNSNVENFLHMMDRLSVYDDNGKLIKRFNAYRY